MYIILWEEDDAKQQLYLVKFHADGPTIFQQSIKICTRFFYIQ